MSDFHIISEQSDLDCFCHRAANQPFLFLDTEFVRTRTLRPKLGLIQAYDGFEVVLIDPLAAIDLDVFWALLTNESITKVLHSCSEDLEVFKFYAKGQPQPLFDTQVAAALLGEGASLGYAALGKLLLDVFIDKGETRTDWLARPLSEKQLAYAAKDVYYLKSMFEQLKQKLEDKGIYDYVLQEGELAVIKRSQEKPMDAIYLDIKNAWRLEPKQLAVLQQLAAWRQQEAERRDLALNFVIKEANMITVAKNQPQNLKQLRQLPGILPQEVRYHGQSILDKVATGLEQPIEDMPEKVVRLVDHAGYKGTYKQLREIVEQAALSHNIPVGSIASKRQLNQLLSWRWKLDEQAREQAFKPDLLHGWRQQIVGEQLLEALK